MTRLIVGFRMRTRRKRQETLNAVGGLQLYIQSKLLGVVKLTSLLTIDNKVGESGRRKQESPNESDDTCSYTGVLNGWDFPVMADNDVGRNTLIMEYSWTAMCAAPCFLPFMFGSLRM